MIAAMLAAVAIAFGLAASGFAHAEDASTDVTVSIAFVGDVMLDTLPGRAIRRGRDPFAPFAKLLDAADIRVGNLECVVATTGTPEPGKPYTFRAHPRTLGVLKRHFDAVSLANNHSGDYGPKAFGEMLRLLEKRGIAYFGGGRDLARAHTPLIIERKGLRIALLGYNEFLPRSFEADHDKPGTAWSEDDQVRLDIATARTLHRADIVIPVMHWGWEYEPLASKRQRELARVMIDAGADAVVGGHPHVTQDTGQHRGRPIVYSLGNFVFDGFTDADTTTGWLLRLEVDRQGARRWRTFVGRIDRDGIPHPDAKAPGDCWERGQDSAVPCASVGR